MKTKALLMALAVVVCTTTPADFPPPAAKAQAIKAAATLDNVLVVAGAGACHWSSSSAHTTCLGNAQKAQNACTSACADLKVWTKVAPCIQKCNAADNDAIDACQAAFDDAAAACRSRLKEES